MNKKELAAALAKKAGVSQGKAMEMLNFVFDAEQGLLTDELTQGNKVTIPGFGTFQVKTRAARVGTHPATGDRVEIPAKKHVSFKAGKTLREQVGS